MPRPVTAGDERRGTFLLYDLLLYLAGVVLAPWAAWQAVRDPGFRRALPGRLGLGLRRRDDRPLLLHGVSVGEVKALLPLVQLLRRERPEVPVLVSASTPTGLAEARRSLPDVEVLPYPLDLRGATRRFLDRVRPRGVVLAELEIWPNFLRACQRCGVPVAIVNGRITEASIRGYRRVQRWLPRFEWIRLYAVQDEVYRDRFLELGVPEDRLLVVGNLKYDRDPPAEPAAAWRAWTSCSTAPWVVLASTHEDEEERLVAAWNRRDGPHRGAVLVVAPRHPRRADGLAPRLEGLHVGRVLRRSAIGADDGPGPGDLVLLDVFGELESAYAVSQCAFVGGSLVPHGGQNVLEAAAAGIPMTTGPHVENFANEVELLERTGSLRRVPDADSVLESFVTWLEDPAAAAAAGAAGRQALLSSRGATRHTLEALDRRGFLAPHPHSQRSSA